MKHIKGLDTLRAFAVIFVIIEHWGTPFDTSSQAGTFIKRYLIPDGQFGVNLFFVLSGYLITSILLHARKENEHGRLQVIKSFIVRRSLRIFPIYYLLLCSLLFIQYVGLRGSIGYYLTYTSNILFYRNGAWGAVPHTWSLAVEEQFYLFWPWLMLYLKERYLKYAFVSAIVVGILSSYITTVMLGKGSQPILVANCLGCFGLGGYYAWAQFDAERERIFKRFLLPFSVLALATYMHWKYAADQFWGYTTFLFRTIDGLISLQIIIAVVNNRSSWVKKYILENSALNYVGRISYGLYLYHYVLQPIYDGYMGRAMARHRWIPALVSNFYCAYCIKLVVLVLLSALSYRIIEQPLLRMKKHFEYN